MPLPREGEPEADSSLTPLADALEKAVSNAGKSQESLEQKLREELVVPLERQLHKLHETLANQQRYITELEGKLKAHAEAAPPAEPAKPPPPPPAKPAAEAAATDAAPAAPAPPAPPAPAPPPPPGGKPAPPTPDGASGGAPPPPPMKGKGPPPPPGMKGKASAAPGDGLGPRPDAVKPKAPVKKLNWKKVPNAAIFASVWKEFTADDPVKLKVNTEKLEDIFSAKKKEEPSAAPAAKAAPRVVNLIDLSRANNIGILLNRLKRTGPEVRAALESADPTFINSAENLEALRKCLPTADEIETLKGYEGDKDAVGPVERFMFAILDQADLGRTLEALTFRAQFDVKVAELLADIRIVSKACEEMRNSKRLRQVLRVRLGSSSLVLSNYSLTLVHLQYTIIIGNFLNAGSAAGNAWGCTLESIDKLKDVRGHKNKTLIDFLISTLRKQSPEALALREDFTALEGAAIGAPGHAPSLCADASQLHLRRPRSRRRAWRTVARTTSSSTLVRALRC